MLLVAGCSIFADESVNGVTSPPTNITHAIIRMYPDLYEASIVSLQAGLSAGHFSSKDLVKAYIARIEEVNLKGPSLRAVLEINPTALRRAAELDAERHEKGSRGALHGIPLLLKDNIATVAYEGMNTTAGTFALQHSIVPDDAGIVKRLRAAGAIILGKTNLSELAHYRGACASGWSGIGGQTTSAYYPGADPSGSSSGSCVSASIGLAAATIGTETDGSIICPSSHNNVVGIKPTVGLTSRAGGSTPSFRVKFKLVTYFETLVGLVVPISTHQDTVGPIARCVADVAVVLSAIAGPDPADIATLSQRDTIVPNFVDALNPRALEGKRIGVPRRIFLDDKDNKRHSDVLTSFEAALDTIRNLGATVVDPADVPSADEIKASNRHYENIVLDVDFKIGLNKYLSSLISNPSGVRNLKDLIKFNDDNPALEKPEGFKDQSILIRSEATTGESNSTFSAALAANRDLGATRGIDAALQAHNLDALVLPSDGITSTLPAIAGYPAISVPLGFFSENVTINSAGPRTVYPAPGVPFGLSFIGTAFSDFDLIGFAYAYETRTKTRYLRRAFPEAIPRTQIEDVL